MKMTRHPASKLFNRKNIALANQLVRGLAIGFLVAISFFALLYSPVRSSITQAVYSVAPSMWNIGDTTTGLWGAFLVNFRNKDSLAKENDTLHADMSRMEAQVLDRNLLAEKVTKLEESLGRARSDDRVVAKVLSGPGRSPYDTLVIDAGTEQGINVGNMVVYAGSGAIGEIVEVSQSSSKVKLYSSPGEEHMVIVGSHYIPVLALGRGMGNFESKVPQDSAVSVGDSVVSTKGNLIFGTVSLVEEKPAEPVKRIFFRVPFNITEIQSVEVIVDKRL